MSNDIQEPEAMNTEASLTLTREGVHRAKLVIEFETATIDELIKFCNQKRVELGNLLRELGNFETSVVIEFRHGVEHTIASDNLDIPAGPCPLVDEASAPDSDEPDDL